MDQNNSESSDRFRSRASVSSFEPGVHKSGIELNKFSNGSHVDLSLTTYPSYASRQARSSESERLVTETSSAVDKHIPPPRGVTGPVQQIHWRAPTSMILFLLFGVVFAIGHHCFYAWLDTQIVNDTDDAWGLTSQQWRLRTGNGFAFLVKVALAAATIVAYQQCVWADLEKLHSVRTIDAMFCSTGDFVSYLRAGFLVRASPLPFVAAVVWLLPISALITPATLTVISSHDSTSSTRLVPGLELNQSSIFTDDIVLGLPSRALKKIVSSASNNAQILDMETIYPNSSYTLNFRAPSLQCQSVPSNVDGYPDRFVSQLAANLSYVHLASHKTISSIITYSGYGAETFYPVFTALSGTMGHPPGSYAITTSGDYFGDCVLGDWTVMGCNFWTTASIIARDPLPALFLQLLNQTWSCSAMVTNFSVPFQTADSKQSIDPGYSYQVVQDWHSWRPSEIDMLEGVYFSGLWIIQAVVDSLLGRIGLLAQDPGALVELKVFGEAAIRDSAANGLVTAALNKTIEEIATKMGKIHGNSISIYRSADEEALTRGLSLGALVEELSRNVTLSLFSKKQFRTSPGQNATVTTTVPVNRYRYASRNLWIAYGISIFFASLCVLLGLRALYKNGVSHNMAFSSVVATTRNHTLDRLFAGEGLGAEPMSSRTLGHKLRFGQLRADEGADGIRQMGFGMADEVVQLREKGLSAL